MDTGNRLRLLAYLRVSSTNADDHEDSAAEQERKIREWAKATGHRIVAVRADEGVSGANGLATRAGLAVALAALAARQADGLVVTKLDRLSRDMVLQEQLLAELHRTGARPFAVSAAEQENLADDPADPSRKMIRRILGAVNEYERDMITLRLRGGKLAKRARGGYTGGFVPLGQRIEDHELVPDEAGQAAVALIEQQHRDGASLREIIEALEAGGHRTKRGGRWHASTVSRVLARTGAAPEPPRARRAPAPVQPSAPQAVHPAAAATAPQADLPAAEPVEELPPVCPDGLHPAEAYELGRCPACGREVD